MTKGATEAVNLYPNSEFRRDMSGLQGHQLLSVLFLNGVVLPVGSSIGDASGSTSVIEMAKICAGYLLASGSSSIATRYFPNAEV